MSEVTIIGLIIDPLLRSYLSDFVNQLSPEPDELIGVNFSRFVSLRNLPWSYATLDLVMGSIFWDGNV